MIDWYWFGAGVWIGLEIIGVIVWLNYRKGGGNA